METGERFYGLKYIDLVELVYRHTAPGDRRVRHDGIKEIRHHVMRHGDIFVMASVIRPAELFAKLPEHVKAKLLAKGEKTMGEVIEFPKKAFEAACECEPCLGMSVREMTAPKKKAAPYMPTYENRYGDKFEKGLTRKDIAVRIRGDIKAALKAGELPKAKYSVRIENYSGGGSISISATGCPFEILAEDRVLRDHDEPHRYHAENLYWMSEPARELEAKLEAIGKAYRRDASDSMVDYFDCNFYLHVKVAGTLPAPEERAAILKRNGRERSS